MPGLTIDQANDLSEDAFAATFGGVFEHSPWIARRAWAARPFADVDDLHRKMCRVLLDATPGEQLGVITAHPDLGERLEPLTEESASEQSAAGLNRLSSAELLAFHENNAAYKAKFGFPFVIAARRQDRIAIRFRRASAVSPNDPPFPLEPVRALAVEVERKEGRRGHVAGARPLPLPGADDDGVTRARRGTRARPLWQAEGHRRRRADRRS